MSPVHRALTTVIVLSFAAGCAARGALPEAAPTSRDTARRAALNRLRTELHQIFTSAELDHAQWGVKVESLRTGETLYSYNAHRFLLPASNQKLLSSAVAAERLGWDYHFSTRLLATGPIDADGTLQGDLVVVGNGDPTINPRHDSRANAFDAWAATLMRSGVRSINGRIVGDDNAFAEPGLGAGWTWENLSYGFGTAIGALQFNENQVRLTISPAAVGSPPGVLASPPFHGMVVEMLATTAAAGAETSADVRRLPGSRKLQVIGEIAADAKPVNITASVENPTELFVNALEAALEHKGIPVKGGAVDVDDLPAPLDLTNATQLLVDYSPPLREIIDVCLKWSRNEYAETLLRTVAPPGQPRTADDALDVLREQLAAWGVLPSSVVPADGSGLSRQDYVTAHALTQLLTYLWMEPRHADVFRSTLPVAGVSGTLAERMQGTPLEGRVWAKTGTLSSVRGLSGYLLTRVGEPIVFSMLSNNYQVPTDEIDAAMEQALLRVFELTASQ
jgi:D-alanyl-D-alanine carboxypeptidase/D-alanyl-D-alanine-endopeptidase (penicillin-binding protein 4)